MADPLDFAAYRELRRAAEEAEGLLLLIRLMIAEAMHLDGASREGFADLAAVIEEAPQLRRLRKVLGRSSDLPPLISADPDEEER